MAGWGGMSPMAGAVVASFGLKAAFAAYFVLVSLAFIPTCLLPIGVLSVPKKGGSGSEGGGKGGNQGATSAKIGTGEGGDEIEVQASMGSQGGGRLALSPQERRARMDSDLASKVRGRTCPAELLDKTILKWRPGSCARLTKQ